MMTKTHGKTKKNKNKQQRTKKHVQYLINYTDKQIISHSILFIILFYKTEHCCLCLLDSFNKKKA